MMGRTSVWARRFVAALTTALLLASGSLVPAAADHSPQSSSGIYRIPYADGTEVLVTNDAHNHNDAYDMRGGAGAEIVAAASGWIRGIVDKHGNSPNPGDGKDINDVDQDGHDALEHSCGNNPTGNTVVGSCGAYNNYVWIEHPNGEWTKYTHFGTGTVSLSPPAGFGWTVGDWINAGQTIGLEGDVGQATNPNGPAFHLHFEVAIPNNPNDPTPFCENGGFMVGPGCNFGVRTAAVVCDIPGNELIDGNTHTANPCDHDPPTTHAGGPYEVDEGSSIQLDGTGSVDPDGNPLTYRWCLGFNDECPLVIGLDDPSLPQPTFTGLDDGPVFLVLNVYDQIEALRSQSLAVVTVQNVPPPVNAVGMITNERNTASLRATVVDPGVADTHTVTVDWGDSSPEQSVTVIELAAGVSHQYGDNGVFDVTVTVTDDDGGAGSDTVPATVHNVGPAVDLDGSGAVTFPGGDYFVVEPGEALPASAHGTDPGSDDLTFTWSTGDVNTYFNDESGPDPFPSPFGTFPFAASDQVVAAFGAAGAETLSILLNDDDGGIDSAEAGVVVTGTADVTQGSGWWKHQFAGTGSPQIDSDSLAGYLAVVNAVSSLFSEFVPAASAADAHAVLSPTGGDRRARATAELLVAWLHFASGAVAWDATVPLGSKSSIGLLDLMTSAEEVILNSASTDSELVVVEHDLARVRHAG